jgi:hypothetical protein
MASSLPNVRDIQPTILKAKKVYSFWRTFDAGTITASTTVDVFGAIPIYLNLFPTPADFTTLFDQYRILEVKVEFVPTSTAEAVPPLTTVIDLDDYTAPTSGAQVMQYQTRQTAMPGGIHMRRFRPRVANAAYSGAFTSFASGPSTTWIDAASPSVQYYGLKYWLPAVSGVTTTPCYTIFVTGLIQGMSPF